MKKCPKCGKDLAPIIYGMPTVEAVQASSRGEAYIGGCEYSEEMPIYHCFHCILDFDKNLQEPTGSNDDSPKE